MPAALGRGLEDGIPGECGKGRSMQVISQLMGVSQWHMNKHVGRELGVYMGSELESGLNW